MTIFIASFVGLLLFVVALSLGMLIKRRPLVSEDDATKAILEGMTCASCHGACDFAGGKEDHSSSECKAKKLVISSKQV